MDVADLPPILPALGRLLVTPDDGRRTPIQVGHLSAKLLAHGSLELRWYAPQRVSPEATDPQVPHDRDELYVVAIGTAMFVRAEEGVPFTDEGSIPVRGEERVAVQPGDVLFVPAGTEHRFEAVSPDFGTWMIFWGPEGGEAARDTGGEAP